ncbi:MAG: 4Fe-4S binding protein [Candidatus Helarchaeota archaeon]
MKKLILNFNANIVNNAITAKIILENQVIINILRANVEESGGIFLIEVPEEHCEKIKEAFEKEGVKVEPGKVIERKIDACINCGACYSICPVNAIIIEEDFSINFDYEKCIGCLSCVETCPVKAIVIHR